MRYLILLFIAVLVFPLSGFCQSSVTSGGTYIGQSLSDVESNEYRSFLKDIRKSDRKREFVDYKETGQQDTEN